MNPPEADLLCRRKARNQSEQEFRLFCPGTCHHQILTRIRCAMPRAHPMFMVERSKIVRAPWSSSDVKMCSQYACASDVRERPRPFSSPLQQRKIRPCGRLLLKLARRGRVERQLWTSWRKPSSWPSKRAELGQARYCHLWITNTPTPVRDRASMTCHCRCPGS